MSKVAIVTGAAGGLGAAMALALAKQGYALHLGDINQAASSRVATDLHAPGRTVFSEHLDITDLASVDRFVVLAIRRSGQIDALLHFAGLDAPKGKAWELGPKHWNDVISVNLNGAWWCVQGVLPQMLKQRSGRIILMGSVASRTSTVTTSAAYNAAKAGINGLAIGLSAQVEAMGIRVNVVAPGPTGTGEAMSEAERKRYLSAYPLGEGGPQPVVEACLYLLGSGGNWISGAVLNVSGGRFRG